VLRLEAPHLALEDGLQEKGWHDTRESSTVDCIRYEG
jgi:hypothetical protein